MRFPPNISKLESSLISYFKAERLYKAVPISQKRYFNFFSAPRGSKNEKNWNENFGLKKLRFFFEIWEQNGFYQAFEWYIQVSCKYYTFGGNHILVWLSKFSKLTIFFKIHNLQARRLGKVAVCQKSCKNWFLGLKKTMGSRKSLLKKKLSIFSKFKKKVFWVVLGIRIPL